MTCLRDDEQGSDRECISTAATTKIQARPAPAAVPDNAQIATANPAHEAIEGRTYFPTYVHTGKDITSHKVTIPGYAQTRHGMEWTTTVLRRCSDVKIKSTWPGISRPEPDYLRKPQTPDLAGLGNDVARSRDLTILSTPERRQLPGRKRTKIAFQRPDSKIKQQQQQQQQP